MDEPISLKEAERKVYLTMLNDGLTDVFLGCSFLAFVIAPLLSKIMVGLNILAIILPFWVFMPFLVLVLKKYVVAPRIGTMRIGTARKKKITKYWIVLLLLNTIYLTIGINIAKNYKNMPGHIPSIISGLFVISIFGIIAYQLDIKRMYLYGFMMGIAPVCGEYLFGKGYASHHGFPLAFGATAVVMIIVGLAMFIRILAKKPLAIESDVKTDIIEESKNV